MGITALSGPFLQYGVTTTGSTDGLTGRDTEYNDQRAPAVLDLGVALADPRTAYSYAPGGAVTNRTMAFYNGRGYVDFVPHATSSIAVVANTASSDEAGTAMTLQAASSARGTYSVAIIAPETGATTGSLLTFDSSDDSVQVNAFGQTATINTWAPGWGAGRCVTIYTASYSDSPVTVHGRDIYGYKVSETISISSVGSYTSSYGGTGVKAFKHIDAVYNSSAPTSTGIAVGTTAKFGFPWYVPYLGQNVTVYVTSAALVQNTALALSSANTTLGSTVATATSTTPDARGTVYPSSVTFSADYRLTIAVTLAASAAAAVTSTNVAPLFGITQYST